MGRSFFLALFTILSLAVGTAQAESRVIRMVPWTYQPTDSMAVTEQNPHPHQALRLIADDWEKLHPGVRIQLTPQAQEQVAYVAWVKTQSTGGTIPEIIFYWPDANLLSQSGWIIPIDKYYEQPNPYVPGNTRWRDLIYPFLVELPFKMMDGHYYFVPVDIFLSALSYNKDAFAAADIADVPKTWAEFIADLDKLDAAGYEPFWGSAMWSNWPRDLLAQYFHDDETFNKLDVLPADGKLTLEEMARGTRIGILTVGSPRFREYLRITKDWSRRWKHGFSLSKMTESVDLFRLGKLGVTWQSATGLAALAEDPYKTFQSGLMWFPLMTKDTSPLARPVAPPLLAIPGTCFFLTASAERNRLTDLCVDWLMFLSTPQNIERLTQEPTNVKIPPSVVGAKVDPVLEPLMAFGYAVGNVVPIPWGATPEAIDNFDRIYELYLLDQLTLDEALDRFRYWEKFGLDQAIHLNQLLPNQKDRWDLSKW